MPVNEARRVHAVDAVKALLLEHRDTSSPARSSVLRRGRPAWSGRCLRHACHSHSPQPRAAVLEIAEMVTGGVVGGRVPVCGTERVCARLTLETGTRRISAARYETNRATFRSGLHPPLYLLQSRLYAAALSNRSMNMHEFIGDWSDIYCR